MKVFISWSGDKGRDVAMALAEWLPLVINSVDPFISTGIAAGARWATEIASELEATSFGIVCVTATNQEAPWLNFEAGALAKTVDESRVVPLAIDIKPSDIKLPLGQFQAQPATAAGVRAVALSINGASGAPLQDARLEKAFDKWWPDFDAELVRIEKKFSSTAPAAPPRTDRELLEEILNTVRNLPRPPATNKIPEAIDEPSVDAIRTFVAQAQPSLRVATDDARGVYILAPEDVSLPAQVRDRIRIYGELLGATVHFRRQKNDGRLEPLS